MPKHNRVISGIALSVLLSTPLAAQGTKVGTLTGISWLNRLFPAVIAFLSSSYTRRNAAFRLAAPSTSIPS